MEYFFVVVMNGFRESINIETFAQSLLWGPIGFSLLESSLRFLSEDLKPHSFISLKPDL